MPLILLVTHLTPLSPFPGPLQVSLSTPVERPHCTSSLHDQADRGPFVLVHMLEEH